jgi:hypothetical protein
MPPIVVNGVRYTVLRLSGEGGNLAFLLRSESGELFGVYRRNAQQALSAAPLELTLSVDNPLPGIDFFEEDDPNSEKWRAVSAAWIMHCTR